MKFNVFILGLVFSSFTWAASHDAPETCMPTAEAPCEHTSTKSYNKDWTNKRVEQVEHVLPQPTQNKAKIATPAAVKIVSPKFLSTINGSNVKLEWTPSENAKVYHLQVSKDAGFNNRSMYVVNNQALTDTSFEVSGLEPNTKYFWRVAAQNNELKESYTKSRFTASSFTTK